MDKIISERATVNCNWATALCCKGCVQARATLEALKVALKSCAQATGTNFKKKKIITIYYQHIHRVALHLTNYLD